jgi:probable F420-dependent oxidoreductase
MTLARKTEALGYSTLLIPDRLQTTLAPFTALAIAAEATTSLRIGAFVFCNDYRHPALLAKEAATLDLLSGGRFELGLGPGAGPSDYTRMGLPYDSVGTRVSRFEEALQVIKQLLTQEVVNFSGQYYTITGIPGFRQGVQKPHPPIFVGCSGKRMLTISARLADSIGINPRYTAQGIDPLDTTPERMQQKAAWIQEAAGERFSRLELGQTIYSLEITDSRTPMRQPAGGPQLPRVPMSQEQAVAYLLERRTHFGYTYLQLHEGQLENFAPVIARLTDQ